MTDHMSDIMNFEVITAEPSRLDVSPGRVHRRWSPEEKARIIEETFAPGANVSAIARGHKIDVSQLFAWRRKALTSGMVAPLAPASEQPVKFTRFEAMPSQKIEIVIGDVVVRADTDVDEDRLARVIRAVRRA